MLRGAATDWPAARWTPRCLAERVGSVHLPVHTGGWEPYLGFVRRRGPTVQSPARPWLLELEAGAARGYMSGDEILKKTPSLRDDLRFPDVGPLRADVVWIGPTGTVTAAHFDRAPNLYVQLMGRKRWQLWRPERRLQGRLGPLAFTMSLTDLVTPERMPLPDLDVELGPGDALYLPIGWWHRVTTVETSVAVNRWWRLGRLGQGS